MSIPDLAECCVLSVLMLIMVIPTVIVYGHTNNALKAIITEICTGAISIVLACVLFGSGVLAKPTGEFQYKVRITESVGYVEFTSKYVVIEECDDGTYIIQEKKHIKE